MNQITITSNCGFILKSLPQGIWQVRRVSNLIFPPKWLRCRGIHETLSIPTSKNLTGTSLRIVTAIYTYDLDLSLRSHLAERIDIQTYIKPGRAPSCMKLTTGNSCLSCNAGTMWSAKT
ncbi:hypothetical protein CDAR_24451 [Caerostris darwini]|uniref:Uncharacterized protein n=1 Tax=Caerostris darwini TaxID=1538125 RepID=A0AAV4QHG7_9ARAC|nr:hypothetical protein CDAR_24451 [Caerostris darwini]